MLLWCKEYSTLSGFVCYASLTKGTNTAISLKESQGGEGQRRENNSEENRQKDMSLNGGH